MKTKDFPSLKYADESKVMRLFIESCKVAIESVVVTNGHPEWANTIRVELHKICLFFLKKKGLWIADFSIGKFMDPLHRTIEIYMQNHPRELLHVIHFKLRYIPNDHVCRALMFLNGSQYSTNV